MSPNTEHRDPAEEGRAPVHTARGFFPPSAQRIKRRMR